ncbi:MAG: hypothetical protein AB1656_22835 [Candidatus Omnitrophota bacterium]
MRKHQAFVYAAALGIIVLGISFSPAFGEDAPPFACVFDTGSSSPNPLTSAAFDKKENWSVVPEDIIEQPFQGDAVLTNNRIALVLRINGPGAELYSQTGTGFRFRAQLSPLMDGDDVRLTSFELLENNPNTAAVSAMFQADNGKKAAVRFQLDMGQIFVNTKPQEGVDKLRIGAPCRFAILPDFFADDIVIDARKIPIAESDLPSENFLLQMLDEGGAILFSVCNTMEQDIAVALAGEGDKRTIEGARIDYGKDGEIWVAVIDAPEVWHERDINKQEAGKEIALDWNVPYPAQWRVDWRCSGDMTDSWEMLAQQPDGTYFKYGWMGKSASFGQSDWLRPTTRERWTTVLGMFLYPCWIDKEGRPWLQPLKETPTSFEGPAVIYPIDRIQETPLEQFSIVDIVRSTLGVGPCEYILDLEGQHNSFKGLPTCASRTKLNDIYAAKKQKEDRKEVEETLTQVMAFINHIRGRIEDYSVFGHEMLAFLEKQKKEHSEYADFISEMETITKEIDKGIAKRADDIKTPEYSKNLVQTFRSTLVDYTGSDAFDKCKKITAAFVEVGGNQDELVGECRVHVKRLRQRAGLAMAMNPHLAPFANEIRERTQKILRNPASYEAARH